MIVRPANLKDAKRATEINVIGWQTAYKGLMPDEFLSKMQVTEKRIGNFESAISNPEFVFLVAEENGQVIGYLHGGKNQENANIPFDYAVYGLYVDPNFQRRGAGRLLLKNFREKIGNASFFLHALKGNDQAMSFYTKAGGVRAPEYDMKHSWGDVTASIWAFIFP